MGQILKTLNKDEAVEKFSTGEVLTLGYQELQSPPEPKFSGGEPNVDPVPISEWIIGTRLVTFKCAHCKTVTQFEVSPFMATPQANCCVDGKKNKFPHQR